MFSSPVRKPFAECRNADLVRLHALEWRHDGPVPAADLAGLDATAAELNRRAARADGALIDRLAATAVARRAQARPYGRPGADVEDLGAERLAACRAAGLALEAVRD